MACFSARATSLSISELTQRTGLPQATVSRLTYTLTEMGYLRRDTSQRRYSLSVAILALGYPMLASLGIRQIAEPHMREFAESVGGTVSLGVLDRQRVVYVESCRSQASSGHLPDIGVIWPVMESAIGRALIAGSDPVERERTLAALRVADPERWASARPGIDEALLEYEAHGFCTSLGDIRKDTYGVAVCLRRPYREHQMAFNCGVPARSPAGNDIKTKIGPRLVRMVRDIEKAVGTLDLLQG